MTTRGRSHYLYISITYFSQKKTGKRKESTTASLPGDSTFSLSESQNSRTSLKNHLFLLRGQHGRKQTKISTVQMLTSSRASQDRRKPESCGKSERSGHFERRPQVSR